MVPRYSAAAGPAAPESDIRLTGLQGGDAGRRHLSDGFTRQCPEVGILSGTTAIVLPSIDEQIRLKDKLLEQHSGFRREVMVINNDLSSSWSRSPFSV